MKTFSVALLFCGSLGSAATAAPFGIPQGTPIKSLQVTDRFGQRSFVVVPPKPNPNFVEYVAIATPPHGVCAVTGTTDTFATFKTAYRRQQQLEKLLSIYGKPKLLGPGANQDWLNMAPGQVPVRWSGALPDGLKSIELETVGEKGIYKVELTYFYKNVDRCSNWEPHQNRQGL